MPVTKYQYHCRYCKRSYLAANETGDPCPYCAEVPEDYNKGIEVTRDADEWPDTTNAGDAQ